jgi:hypothetical protein
MRGVNTALRGHDVSVLRICSEPGCATYTMGGLCIAHEPAAPQRSYPRGRPYRLDRREVLAPVVRAGKTTAPDVVLLEGAP